MSTQQHHNDSSLNNQPERDANKLANANITNSSTGTITNEKDTEKKSTPLDKQGDTWTGGITFVNKQVK
jgi:hypothetical protein